MTARAEQLTARAEQIQARAKQMTAVEQCECGAALAFHAGSRHPYVRSTAACWRAYGELASRVNGQDVPHVDVWAAQHYSGAEEDRRQRQSVAVHLVAMCIGIESPHAPLSRMRARLSREVLPRLGRTEWPLLEAPTEPASVTVASLAGSTDDGVVHDVMLWRDSVWEMWKGQHDVVRGWAALAWVGQ